MGNRSNLLANELLAILPSALDQVCAVLDQETPNLDRAAAIAAEREALMLRAGDRLAGTNSGRFRDGVAILPLIGPIFPRANLFTDVSGATSLEQYGRDVLAAQDNPAVKVSVLAIDSPGGSASGVAAFAAVIRRAVAVKPIVAHIENLGASAAFWIACACSEIVLGPTAVVGSIGALMMTTDRTKADAAQGIRRVVIRSAASPKKGHGPETDVGLAEAQNAVDALAEKFVTDVANDRGVSIETVLADFGAGGVVPRPADAIARGMADRQATLEDLIDELAAGKTPAPRSSSTQSTLKGLMMDTIYNSNSNAPIETRAKAEWDRSAALRDEFADDFGAYLAFCRANENGQVRLYQGRRGDAA